MLVLANLLLLCAAIVLLPLVATARPTRGESMMGFHRITIPIALAMTVALALGLSTEWQSQALPAWPLYAGLPAYLIAVAASPFACFASRGRRLAKLIVLSIVLGTALALNGAMLAPNAQLAGGITVLAVEVFAYAAMAYGWLGPKLRRLFRVRANRGVPSESELKQGQWQREQWQLLPPDANLLQLLQFARSFDPEVKAQCLLRIRDLPQRDSLLLALLLTPDAADATYYIVHLYPDSRATLAEGMAQILDAEHAEWLRLIKTTKRPNDIKRPIMDLLECGTAIMMDGGSVKAQMQRWQQLLSGIEPMAGLAREMKRYLKKAR